MPEEKIIKELKNLKEIKEFIVAISYILKEINLTLKDIRHEIKHPFEEK